MGTVDKAAVGAVARATVGEQLRRELDKLGTELQVLGIELLVLITETLEVVAAAAAESTEEVGGRVFPGRGFFLTYFLLGRTITSPFGSVIIFGFFLGGG